MLIVVEGKTRGRSHANHSCLTLYNGVSEQWSFNTLQRPTQLAATAGSTALMSLGWSYNTGADNGNVMGQTISRSSGLAAPLSQTYGYADPANRLYAASETGGWSQTYSYDAFGNRALTASSYMPNQGVTPVQGASGVPANQFPNNQWIRGTGDSYDGAGNQLSLAQYGSYGTVASTFSYDGENRLLKAITDGASFVYDGEGRRVQKTSPSGVVTTYVHDAMGNLAAEYSAGADPASGTQYLSADHLGSTRLVTDANGNPVRCFDYLPFGEEIPAGMNGRTGCYETMGSPQYPTSPDVADQKFTGKERDAETGLDYFGARYFSSAQGRFTSPDWSATPAPVPYADFRDPQTLNLYSYVRNNPLRLRDEDGHGFWTKLGNWLTDGGWNEDAEAQAERQRKYQAEVTDARKYFTEHPTSINGQIVDPDKTPDREIVNDRILVTPVLCFPCSQNLDFGMAGMVVEPGQLQAKFKHAEDFGVKGNWNKTTAQEFDQAVQSHVTDPATQTINGTYRGQSVVHHVNPQTGLNVMTDPAGKFISGWKLNPQQLQNVLTRGSL